MTKAQVKSWLLGLVGISADAKAELEKQADSLPEDAAPQPAPQSTTPQSVMDSVSVAAMVAQEVAKATKPLVDALTVERQQRENAAKTAAEQALAARKADVKKLLDDAIAAGKIPADNKEKREKWEAQFEANYDTAKFALEEIPAARQNVQQNGDKQQDGQKVRGVNPAVGMEALKQSAAAAFSNN